MKKEIENTINYKLERSAKIISEIEHVIVFEDNYGKNVTTEEIHLSRHDNFINNEIDREYFKRLTGFSLSINAMGKL